MEPDATTISEAVQYETRKSFNPTYIVYMIEGAFCVLFNGLVAFTIFRYKKLRDRKEYVILGALSAADTGCGLGVLLAGIFRSYRIYHKLHLQAASVWDCFTIYSAIRYVFTPLSMMMLTIVSIDRLIAVRWPVRYFSYTKAYAYKLCAIVWVPQFLLLPVLASISYSKREQYTATWICYSGMGTDEAWHEFYHYSSGAWAGIMSIVIYVVVMVLQKMRVKNKVDDATAAASSAWRQAKQREEDGKRQARLVTILGISSMFTLIFVVIPQSINSVLGYIGRSDLTVYFSQLNLLNPILNIFIYFWRLSDVRTGMKAVVMCKAEANAGI